VWHSTDLAWGMADAESGDSRQISLRLDTLGAPQVAWDLGPWPPQLDQRGILQHTALRGDVWRNWPTVGRTPNGEHSLALDKDGQPVIAFTGSTGIQIGRPPADPDAEGWELESLTALGFPPTLTHPSLAIDNRDVLHLGCHDSATGALYYLRKEAGPWELSLVDPHGGPGSAIALDGNGQPQIAYPNTETGALQWATAVATRIWLPQILLE
jgi:hypothetical protein